MSYPSALDLTSRLVALLKLLLCPEGEYCAAHHHAGMRFEFGALLTASESPRYYTARQRLQANDRHPLCRAPRGLEFFPQTSFAGTALLAGEGTSNYATHDLLHNNTRVLHRLCSFLIHNEVMPYLLSLRTYSSLCAMAPPHALDADTCFHALAKSPLTE
jgi:hypothetical protein